MTPEERQLLIQTHRLVEENNALLRKMRRSAIVGRVIHLLYWAIIIGFSVGAYYVIQPYVDQIRGIYDGFKGNVESVKGSAASALSGVGELFQNIGE
ncbi:MAG TPA: hypothetical protein DEF00_02845 [Candidatus Taylorbacteria bacterium]|uniref:Uncharacterized protein n=1 Tax=Candidatus Kaiserbacteria bacterium GW2011_GWA2_49_56 TaxID=1618670 RepID=A0A0G1VSI1_9BACT|nr:MAG: hypothetical protein UY29_C0011G0006 [Parcubacteria group bacterium GW2011_GWC2_48_17]KKW09426.1 MAG: hypothetical protein UY46_C0001G0006 [Candidatus Kaiserbacteria bacterium GW2011_GWA2_49_56]HBV01305.1 hypothetical protein [Candidatus Taylorbacteria bacterium]